MSLGELNPKQNGRNVPGCMQLISYQNLAVAAASITFANIPLIYNHLKLFIVSRTNYAGGAYDYILLQFNNDTGNNYNNLNMQSQSTTASCNTVTASSHYTCGPTLNADDTANYPGTLILNMPSYTNNSFFKNMNAISAGAGSAIAVINNGQWINSAISSISTISLSLLYGTAFIVGSSFSLYGIT